MAMKDADRMERFMRQMAAVEQDCPVPSASAIWWRAELQRRVRLEDRAMRPMRIAEGIACALCIAAVAVMAGQLGNLQVFIR